MDPPKINDYAVVTFSFAKVDRTPSSPATTANRAPALILFTTGVFTDNEE